jgi:protein subunit release factor A
VVTSSEKSQHENRRKAMEQLKIRLYEREREMKDTARAELPASCRSAPATVPSAFAPTTSRKGA